MTALEEVNKFSFSQKKGLELFSSYITVISYFETQLLE